MHVKIRKRIGNPTLYNAKINYSLLQCLYVHIQSLYLYIVLCLRSYFKL